MRATKFSAVRWTLGETGIWNAKQSSFLPVRWGQNKDDTCSFHSNRSPRDQKGPAQRAGRLSQIWRPDLQPPRLSAFRACACFFCLLPEAWHSPLDQKVCSRKCSTQLFQPGFFIGYSFIHSLILLVCSQSTIFAFLVQLAHVHNTCTCDFSSPFWPSSHPSPIWERSVSKHSIQNWEGLDGDIPFTTQLQIFAVPFLCHPLGLWKLEST